MSCNLTFEQIGLGLQSYQGESSDFILNEYLPDYRHIAKKPASVLIPLIKKPKGINVIFTRRSSHLKYHAGQISFPGGKAEEGDRNALATALREAKEEINLNSSKVKILGQCPAYETVTGFRITPFVGKITPPFKPSPQIAEVAEIFEVSFNFLMDLENYKIKTLLREGKKYRYLGMNYNGYHIWGATARILFGLANHLNSFSSDNPKYSETKVSNF